jgi:hypothetical protein
MALMSLSFVQHDALHNSLVDVGILIDLKEMNQINRFDGGVVDVFKQAEKRHPPPVLSVDHQINVAQTVHRAFGIRTEQNSPVDIILDRLVHHSTIIKITGKSNRLQGKIAP